MLLPWQVVFVVTATYWADRARQLAEILRTADKRVIAASIGEPTGRPPTSETMVTVTDPEY